MDALVQMERLLDFMVNLNGTIWQINTLGKNDSYYYITVSDETNFIDYVIDVSVIDQTQPEIPQIYNYILTQPDFAGGTLISS
jgi:hypothetical protein